MATLKASELEYPINGTNTVFEINDKNALHYSQVAINGSGLSIDKLNLIAGTNITLTYSAGNVTISSGGGGSVDPRLNTHLTYSGVTNIPTTTRLVTTEQDKDATLSLAKPVDEGYVLNIIIHNTGSSTIAITLPNNGTTSICLAFDVIYIAPNKYGEVCVQSGKSNINYFRGANSI